MLFKFIVQENGWQKPSALNLNEVVTSKAIGFVELVLALALLDNTSTAREEANSTYVYT